MKKGSILILFLLLTLGFMLSNKTVSKAKKLEKKETRSLYVQQGKTYKLSKILSDIKDPDEGISLKKCLKGKTVKWSVNKKQITDIGLIPNEIADLISEYKDWGMCELRQIHLSQIYVVCHINGTFFCNSYYNKIYRWKYSIYVLFKEKTSYRIFEEKSSYSSMVLYD